MSDTPAMKVLRRRAATKAPSPIVEESLVGNDDRHRPKRSRNNSWFGTGAGISNLLNCWRQNHSSLFPSSKKKSAGVKTRLVVYPGEGHVFSKPALADASRRALDFLTARLRPRR